MSTINDEYTHIIADEKFVKDYVDEKLNQLGNTGGSGSDTVIDTSHFTDTNNPHNVTASQIGAQEKITGTAGQFVVIGSDGNVTTMTIPNASGVSF